ncbi:HAMP domain-containing sensor histidine kinase [Inquilinus sp. CAU 1745]|uniref:sensor histidine kinase n=1 Tax=Inquilinus sp. CAU 1745 TaxID=3140369 RepID=UPI00325B25B7
MHPASGVPTDRRILGELNDLFGRARRWHLLALHLAVAGLIAWALRDQASPAALTIFLSAISVSVAINAAARFAYARARFRRITPEKWRRTFAGCAALAGLSWGLTGSLLYWGPPSLEKTLIAVAFIGLCSNSAMGYAMNRAAAQGFLFAVMLPFATVCLAQPTAFNLILGLFVLFYLRAMTLYVDSVHRAQVGAIRLRLDREKLIAELETAKADLSAAVLEADRANRAKSDFLATMSHELRTPLNAIIGFSELIRDRGLGPDATDAYADYAGDIHSSGSMLLDLINDILDLSRIEAGRFELQEETVDLAAAVRGAVRMMAVRSESRGLALDVELPDDLPPLRADTRATRQMIVNLLSNAVKFTPPGGAVRVSARADADGVRLSVADTGIGMSNADIAVALEPFGQVRNDLPQDMPGTGLGLPLVKSMIERHGGRLEIESQPGQGSALTLAFPPHRILAPRPPLRVVNG